MWRNLLITVATLFTLTGLLTCALNVWMLNTLFFGEYTATINGITRTYNEPLAGFVALNLFFFSIALTFTLMSGEAVIKAWKAQPLSTGKVQQLLWAGLRAVPPLFGPIFGVPLLSLAALEVAAENEEQKRIGKP